MPGRNKATCGYGSPELAVGQQAAEGGRDAGGRSPHGDEEEERGGTGPEHNLGDPDIVKSPSDPKQYRYIKLQNGLCALLISDLNYLDGAPTSSEEEEENDDDSEEGSDEYDDSGAEIEDGREDDDDECDDGDESEDSDGDNEDFNDSDDSELEELADKEETRKRGCSEKQSAAALCVAVGSFSDPEDLPGLAHFLEHMVFMGSLKYPDENGFDAFLKKHGGGDNASTDCERTVFQFDVQRKYFREALDRWAQFFIHPLMIRDAIDREVEAVDSGNADTLKHQPKMNNIDTYTRLREFWQRHYSAHYMTLVVQSKETLDTLEKWVTEIFSEIPNKFWALALYGGNGETGFEQNSTYSIFSISVTLTDEGYKHFYETDPVDYVENLCENMQLFQKEDFLTGDQLLFEYKPEIIADALNQLTPQRANLVLLSAANEGQCHLKEKWFGTQYSMEDIDKYWSDLWDSDFELNPDLHLPEENKYIATDFALKVADCPETEYPVRTLSTQQGCLWYRKDDKFKIPKGYVRFHLISPLIQQSAENIILFDTFVNILSHNLGEPAYEADVAQLEYKLVAGEYGLIIRVKGFNHKLPLLFQLIIDYLSDFSFTPAVFEMITEQLKKTYYNILIKPETLAKDVRLLILEHGRWSMIDKYQRLMKGLSIEALSAFVTAFKSQLFVEGLVQGNFTSREAKDFLNYVVQKLQFSPLAHPCPVQFRVVDLPNTHLLCKVKTLNKGDANSEVTVYYQSGARNLREYTLMELLVMHMEEPCFDFLRTKQTLGYHVYPTCRNTSGILGFSVTVATQATKYNSELVDRKIEEFLSCFEEKIKDLTEEAFSTQVTALIKLKECEDSHLGEEVDRNWNEVVTQQYLFDRLAREIEALKSITQADLVNWFQAHRSNQRKVLSVHVIGYGKHEGDSEVTAVSGQNSSSGEIPHLVLLPPSSLMSDITSIKDIKAYTSTLNVLPYHKILK
ncbi:hypothetical protein DUI87_14927 [Hirundo rustica rustica]|uniref:Nardilysin n=1 Tax=Hirundo rustica rustica TaxID=333673 RepID=A0A3M0K685_HIRRU|nr:hypothetical protein DUI87_14927 [Hirundo rustica rustica]